MVLFCKIVIPGSTWNPATFQQDIGCARLLRSLRLPSVALLEFTPCLIRGRNDIRRTIVGFLIVIEVLLGVSSSTWH